MADYIPQFDAWLENFRNKITADPATYGVDQATADQIKALTADWDARYSKSVAAQEAAKATVAEKDGARAAVLSLVRPTVARIQVDPDVSDCDKQAAGLPLRKAGRTPAPVPSTRPVVEIDAGQRLRHLVKFRDEASPRSTAKPKGVAGCEVWVKVGSPAPAEASELHFLGTDTRTPYLAEYHGEDANQIAY